MVDGAVLVPAEHLDARLHRNVVCGRPQHSLGEVLQTGIQARQYLELRAQQPLLLFVWIVCIAEADVLALKAHKHKQQVLYDSLFLCV